MVRGGLLRVPRFEHTLIDSPIWSVPYAAEPPLYGHSQGNRVCDASARSRRPSGIKTRGGARSYMATLERPCGQEEFTVEDPEGNRLTF